MNISATQLRRAADIQDKIELLQGELNQIFSNGSAAATKPERKRRKMSAAARAKIGVAQRARWAKVRSGKK